MTTESEQTTEAAAAEPSLLAVPPTGEASVAAEGGDSLPGNESVPGNDSLGGESAAGNESAPAAGGEDSIAPLTADSYAEVTLPEGLTVDDALFGEAKSIFAEAGVKPSEAPKLLGVFEKALKAQAEAQQAAFQTMNETWKTEALALPEFSGAKREASQALIAKVIDEFGGDEVREVLNATGAGNNPALVRMVLKIGEALSEGRPARTGQPANSGGKKSYADAVYGPKT